MSFTKNDLDTIKSKISIRNELEKKTKIVQKGKDFWCCCPFHEEKTPSCKITEDPGSFYCFGCGAKGDIFTLYTDLYNYNFIEAVKELALRSGIVIDFKKDLKTKEESKVEDILDISCKWYQNNLKNISANICNEYLRKRNLTNTIIEKFRLGYSSNSNSTLYDYLKKKGFNDSDLLESNIVKFDKNKKIRDYFYKRLIFPIMDIQGRVVGFGGRSLDNSNPKYINSPESKFFKKRNLLFNLNFAKTTARKKNNLLICEGYMDVISLTQNGITSVVAPLGTSLTEDQLDLAWRYSTKPTIMFDGDTAGIRASYKSAIMALPFIKSNKFLQFVDLPFDYDPDSYINKVSFDQFINKLKNPVSLSEYIFNHSIRSVSIEQVDQKISYDKYLDDLIETIKDQKIKYFYKNEFKSLFFNAIRKRGKKKSTLNTKNLESNLNEKQIYSFFAAAINHLSIRKNILDELEQSELINEENMKFIKELKANDVIIMDKNEVLLKFKKSSFSEILEKIMAFQIYQLFPYASLGFDPQKSLEEVLKSLKNLNTRLSNLKKINKSLNKFVNESSQLNWSDLQSINIEISDED